LRILPSLDIVSPAVSLAVGDSISSPFPIARFKKGVFGRRLRETPAPASLRISLTPSSVKSPLQYRDPLNQLSRAGSLASGKGRQLYSYLEFNNADCSCIINHANSSSSRQALRAGVIAKFPSADFLSLLLVPRQRARRYENRVALLSQTTLFAFAVMSR